MAPRTISPVWERRLDRAVAWALRNWLLFANGLLLIYAGTPWLAPLAYASGHPLLGQILFAIYTPLCHQKPERSFFVGGYQVAYCHRDVALYTGVLAAGLAFGLLRGRVRPLPLRAGAVLLLPILIDGIRHMVEDVTGAALLAGGDAVGSPNFWLRMITGVLAALALVALIYPRLERDLSRAQAVAPA